MSSTDYFQYKKTTYLPLREADIKAFSDEELNLIRDVADFVANRNTAQTISEFSHNLAWEMAEFGEEIPYHTAFALFPGDTSDEAVDWATSVVDQTVVN